MLYVSFTFRSLSAGPKLSVYSVNPSVITVATYPLYNPSIWTRFLFVSYPISLPLLSPGPFIPYPLYRIRYSHLSSLFPSSLRILSPVPFIPQSALVTRIRYYVLPFYPKAFAYYHPSPLSRPRYPVPVIPSPLSDTRYPISVIRYPLSHILYPIPVIPYPLSRIRYPVSVIPYPLSRIRYPVSVIPYPLSRFRYPVFVIPSPLSRLRYPLSVIRYPLSRTRYPVYPLARRPSSVTGSRIN